MKNPINIETTKEKFFLQYLTILNPIALHLTPMGLKVLAAICYIADDLTITPLELKNKVLFSTPYRKIIRENIKDESGKTITDRNFNNYLEELKKKNLITGNHSEVALVKWLHISSKDNLNLTFNWKIKNE